MATVLITGGSGLIGQALAKQLLAKGYAVIILSRSLEGAEAGKRSKCSYAQWNVEAETIDKEAIQAADYIVHLAGANLAERRWTEKRKREIRESRTKSGDLLVKA